MLLAFLALGLAPRLQAQATFTWDGGGGNNNWTTANNWNPNGAPTASTLTNYVFGVNTRTTNAADGATVWEVNRLTFGSGAGAYTISSTAGMNLYAGGIVQNDNSTQIISAPITLQADSAVSGTGSGAVTLSGALSGSFGLTKSISGTLTFNGTTANTYTGVTTINAGTLTLAKTTNVVSVAGNIVIGDGAGTDILRTNAAGQIASTSAITFNAAGTPTFNLNNNAQSVGSISSTNTGAVITLGNGNLTTGGDNTSTSFAGVISGTGGLTKNGTGTLTLAGNSTYSGATVINTGGTLKLGAAGSGANTPLGTATGNTTVATGGALDLGGFTLSAAEALSISGTGVGGTGALTNTGGAATYSGQITLGAAATIGGTGNITLSNATPLVGNFLLTKSDSGNLIISNSSGARTGGVQVDAGTLTFGNATAIGATSQTITLNGGNLNLASGTAVATYPVSVTASSTITANRSTSGADLGHSFGALTMGNASTLSVVAGSNITTNAAYGLTFGATTLSSNAALDVANNGSGLGTVTLGALSGNFDLNKQGAGTLALNSASSRTGGSATLTAGTLSLGSTTALGSTTGTTLLLNGGTLDLNTNTSVFGYNTTVGGDAAITSDKATAASAGITHTLGTLSIGSNTLTVSPGINVTSGTAGLAFGATTLTGNATFNVASNANAAAALTLGALGDGSTARTLTFSGNGTTTLGSAATSLVDGTAVSVTAGTLNTNNATALGALANVTVSTGATVSLGASQTFGALNGTGGTVTLGSNTLTVGSTNNLNSSFGGAIDGTGGVLTKAGSGVLTLSGASGYTGGTNINAGTLNFSALNNLGTGAISFGGGTLQWNTGNTADISSRTVTFNSGGATLDTNGNNVTLGGAIGNAGTGALIKTGAGTLTLSGANTYTGPTTISQGTVQLNANAPSGSAGTLGSATSSVVVNDGSTGSNNTALLIGTSGVTVGRNVDVMNFGSGTTTLGGNISSGTGTFSGNVVLGRNVALSSDSTANITFSGPISGSGAVNKTGTGTVTLSGTNIHAGGTTLTAGTLNLNSASALGSGAFTIAGGTIDNTSGSAITLSTNNAQNWNSDFTFTGTNNLNLGTGAVTMNASRQITTTGGNLTVGGVISGTGYSLTKAGAGALTLSGADTYTGGTTLSAGTLNLNNASALGSGTFTIAGGTIDNTSGSAITLSTNNAQNWNSDFAFTGTNNLNLGTGAVTLSGNRQVTANAGTMTVGGVIAGSGLSLTKAGAGELALSGANTYTGGTVVSAGSLTVTSTGSLASAGALTVNGGTLSLNNSAQTVSSLTGSGGTVALGTNHNLTVNNSGSDSFSGVFTGGASTTLTKSGTGNLVLSGASSGFTGAVTVNTGGTLTLANSNAIGNGTASTTVNNGGAIALSGGVTVSRGNLSIAGTGAGGGGAIVNTGGNNAWSGNITLTANSTVKLNSPGSDSLDLGINQPTLSRPPVDASTISLGANTLTVAGGAGSGIVYLNGSLTGTGGLNVNMNNAGDKVYLTAHQNTFTGTTQILNGTLLPYTLPNTYPGDNAAGGGTDQYYGINGPVTIGDGVGAANSAVLEIAAAGSRTTELINSKVPITLNRDGQFLVGSAQTIGAYDATINPSNQSLIFNGGNVTIGSAGVLYLAGDVKVNATAGETAVIDGVGNTLSLTTHKGVLNNPANANRAFDVGAGAGNTSDLTINATIKDGSITKNGTGVMTITGNNSAGYEGTTTINNGKIVITNSSALGQGLNDAASATRVNSGGTLQLQGGVTVSNEWLYLNGSGFGSGGALRNESGNNTWAGSVFLESGSRTQSQSGLLTISGSITSSNNSNLEVRGTGNTTISGAIGTGNGGITKDDSGTLILSGANTYAGATTVNAGVLSLQSSSGLGSAGSGTTVAGGAELHLNNTAIGGGSNVLTTLAEPLTITGTGVSGQGALRSVSGPNVFGGQVTLGGAALVSANSGHSLTIAGGTTTGGNAYGLTVGTTAENGNVTISGNMSNSTGSLTKNGTGTLTFSGTTGTVGQTALNTGTISVGGSSTLNTAEFSSAASTTLIIASGGTVVANYASGSTTFAGSISGGGTYGVDPTATFQKNGAGTLVFDHSFNAGGNSTLVLNGGTLSLLGSQITFGTIHITGNTILDFNNSAGTFLSSARLVIDAGVQVTVNNWISVANNTALSTIWYATDTVNAGTLAGTDIVGGTPLGQITFTNYNGLTTTWVSGAHDGWFNHEIRPTPEPSTYGAIFLSGCLGLLGWRRLRTRQQGAKT